MTSNSWEFSLGLESILESSSGLICSDGAKISPRQFRGARVGVLMNRASVDRRFRWAHETLANHVGVRVVALFSPQHGFWSDAQANMIESPHSHDLATQLPVYSLYSETRRPTAEMLDGLEWLVIDLQDVGVRVYTFVWTALACMRACAECNVSVLVLDRPNPIGGCVVEGPCLRAGFESFVGGASIPMRHGLTIGELCRLLHAEESLDAPLVVAPLRGWDRDDDVFDWSRGWLPTSPNLPRAESLYFYPGQVLMEGVNLSEGRGTTTPFEWIGAPFLHSHRIVDTLNGLNLPGVRFLPARFSPTFDKFRNADCEAVSMHLTDRRAFRSYRTAIEMLRATSASHPNQFRLNDPPYEYEEVKPPIDIISGGDSVRRALNEGRGFDRLVSIDMHAWRNRVADRLLYGDADKLTD